MSNHSLLFALPDNLDCVTAERRPGKLRIKGKARPRQLRRVFLDTFDWRLYRRGNVLEAEGAEGDYRLRLRHLHSGETLLETRMPRLPRRALEVMDDELREALKQQVQRREIQARVSLASQVRTLRLVDHRKRPAGVLELRREQLIVPRSTRRILLPGYAVLFPARRTRKKQKRLERLYHTLRQGLSLQPAEQDPLISALRALGKNPHRYNNRPLFHIVDEQPTWEVLGEILRVYLQLMESNVEGACEGQDPEFLRDFMIAARRTMCLLNRIPVFDSPKTPLIRQDFQWIEQIAAPVRDLDIYLELFDEFASDIDTEYAGLLRDLHDYHIERKRREVREMCTALQSPRFRKMMRNWHDLICADHPPDSKIARQPIRLSASAGIHTLLQEVIQKGQDIHTESSPADVCRLLQSAKRLGYHLDLFAPFYDGELMNPLLQDYHKLMNALSAFRASHLQHEALLDYKSRVRQEQRFAPMSFEAIHRLIADRARKREKARRTCAARFSRFVNRSQHGRNLRLFRP